MRGSRRCASAQPFAFRAGRSPTVAVVEECRVSRTRSEYVLSPPSKALARAASTPQSALIRGVRVDDRDVLASLLLDAYRGTVDDEGEGNEEAHAAIDDYFARLVWGHSMVLDEGDSLSAISFIVIVDGRHYVDPVATASTRKGEGRGTRRRARVAPIARRRWGTRGRCRHHRWQHAVRAAVRGARVRPSRHMELTQVQPGANTKRRDRTTGPDDGDDDA